MKISYVFYYILVIQRNIAHDINATTGTVIIQADTILKIISLLTYISFLLWCFLSKYSLKNHIQKIHQIAIWVELTGNHNWLARITVIAADKAIQKALTWSISVISHQTLLIILGQNRYNHIAIQNHHIDIIQKGISAFVETHQFTTLSYIQAKGQTAFATSLAQCAKVSNATENIRGIENNLFTDSLVLKIHTFSFFNILLTTKNTIIEITNHINQAW